MSKNICFYGRPCMCEYLTQGSPYPPGAVTLHAAVGSLLFQPVEWHLKEEISDPEVPPDKEKLLLEPGTMNPKGGELPRGSSVPSGLMMHDGRASYPGLPKRSRAYSECARLDPAEWERGSRLPSLAFGGSSLMASVHTLTDPAPPRVSPAVRLFLLEMSFYGRI